MGRHDGVWQLTMADPHTGLANKNLTLDRLDQALARRERHNGDVMVMYIHLVNIEEYGYDLGMEALGGLSRRLMSSLRDEDAAGRVAGNAVVLVVSFDSGKSMEMIAQRLEATCQRPFIVGGRSVHLSARFGAVLANGDESAEEVLERARLASQ